MCLGRKPLVILWTYHSIHWQQLVSPFEASVSFSHPSRNDARDINGGVLLLSSHHVKTKAFISLWQFDYPRVGVAFTSCKSCNCCLKEKTGHSVITRGKWGSSGALRGVGQASPPIFYNIVLWKKEHNREGFSSLGCHLWFLSFEALSSYFWLSKVYPLW